MPGQSNLADIAARCPYLFQVSGGWAARNDGQFHGATGEPETAGRDARRWSLGLTNSAARDPGQFCKVLVCDATAAKAGRCHGCFCAAPCSRLLFVQANR